MKLNKSTNDAIRILVDCARGGGALVKVADVSARLDITVQNVFKIVHILSRSDLVAPVRGRNGGVRLSRPPEEIRVGDVVRAMESTDFTTTTSGRKPAHARDVTEVLDSALEAFLAVLDQHSLADLMANGKASGARTRGAKPVAEAPRRQKRNVRSLAPRQPSRAKSERGSQP